MELILLFFICSPLVASPEVVPIQEKAQGQSLTGANLLNDSLYSNPAGSSFTQVYSVEALYFAPRNFAASILDTKTSGFGGALGYYRNRDYSISDPLQVAKLALSTRVQNWLGLGIAGKVMWGPNDQGEHVNFKDIDFGLLANLNFLQLGFTVRNLLGGEPSFNQDQEWALGARANYEQLLFLSASAFSKWGLMKPYQFGIGAEYVSLYYFSLKGGFRIQPDSDRSFWSTGISILAPKIGLHYAVEIPNQAPKAIEHLVGANLIL